LPRDLNSKLRAEAVAKLRAVFCLPATCQAAVKHQTKEHRSKAFNARLCGVPERSVGASDNSRLLTP